MRVDLWTPAELAAWGTLNGPDEIMAILGLPWSTILKLVDFEGLPVHGLPDHPTLTLENLTAWEEARREAGRK